MAAQIITRGLLPVVLFPTLSYLAIKIVFGDFFMSNTAPKLGVFCSAPIGDASYRQAYTGVAGIDDTLCILVAFFQNMMDPFYQPFLVTLFTGLTTVAIIPFVEAAREKRTIFLSLPAVVGLIYQLKSMAITMPIYWMVFVLTGSAGIHKDRSAGTRLIHQANAESLLFALLVGFVVPSVLMVVLEDPRVTAFWQAFPLWIELSQLFYRLIRPTSRYVNSGYSVLQGMYAFMFALSALGHIYYVWPLMADFDHLRSVFIPVVHPFALPFLDTTVEEGVMEFIKWDAIFGFSATGLVTLWFAEDFTQVLTISAALLLLTVVAGPGAAIVSVFMWREAKLNARNIANDKSKTS